MALTRKFLRAMGIEDEKVDQIIEAHSETVNALKEERDNFKETAEKLSNVEKELNDLKAKGDDGLNEKYSKLEKEFNDYKAEIDKKTIHAEKERMYRELLKTAGVKEKYFDTCILADQHVIDGLTIKDGKLENSETILETAKSKWSDFVPTVTTTTTSVETPPGNIGGTSKTKEEILAMKDKSARMNEIAKNPQLFGI